MKRSDISTYLVLQAAGQSGVATGQWIESCMGWEAKDTNVQKVVCAAIQREVEKDLVDYGVNIWFAFLTKEGRQWIALMESEHKHIDLPVNPYTEA